MDLKTPFESRDPRRRLLDAAGEVFAARGYHDATTLEICKKARINGAAVNYHFGGKERLYQAVLREAFERNHERPPWIGIHNRALPPEERLRSFIHALFFELLTRDRPAWHGRLIAREMVRPSEALPEVVDQSIRPIFVSLCDVIQQLAPGLSGDQVKMAAVNTAGMVFHYFHCRPMIAALWPALEYSSESVDRIADFAFLYTRSALRGLASTHRKQPVRPAEPKMPAPRRAPKAR
ncbi:MAG TPA: CerR family C-terminal domain-containing protein [bacterium]|nr:CerR family C-terminal domain-containing protein [bacterium]